MADHFPFKLERKATIAVMGLPYTFRKEMGEYISNWAKCPNLTFEVILDELPNFDEIGAAADISIDRSDVAFSILGKTALSLLNRRQPNCVVINFPIPTKPQLEKLISLHHQSGRRLLIIECQRRSVFRWRLAVEDPSRGLSWYRRYDTGNIEPGKWEDVEKAIQKHQQQQQQGLDDTLATYHFYVKKLVVDPFQDLRSRDFTYREGLDRGSLFAQAIKNHLACDDDDMYRKVGVKLYYSVWRREWLEHRAEADSSRRGTSASSHYLLCEPGDCILRFTNNLKAGDGDPICEACEQKVTEGQGAYYCQLCSLSLHELCAVALSTSTANTTANSSLPRSKVVKYYSRGQWGGGRNLFPQSTHVNNACYSCKREGNPFSLGCDACVYKAHLKAQLLPTALKHSYDQHHILSIRLSRWDRGWRFTGESVYDCKACGLRGRYSSYSCNICNSEYHLECVLQMPLQTKGNPKHGGHTHNMEIQFCCGEKEYEYEWCPVCYEDIDPDTWVYTCQHCDFVAHLYCLFPSETFRWYKRFTESK